MSTTGVTSSLFATGITSSSLSQITSSTSTENQFVTDMNQVSNDLQEGKLSAAQEDYVTLSADALNGTTGSTATSTASGITDSILSDVSASSSSEGAFVTDLNEVGTDLQSGNLSSAQSAMLALDSTALSASSSEGSSAGSEASNATTVTPPVDSQKLIEAIVEAIAAGDDSAVSSDMAALASIAPSSAGATVLQQESASYGSSASDSSATSSIGQLL
ncbi:MAG: hypothetical protein WBY53_09585 [Acidobacteriaceae bacterium]